ncbi:MAG TPA: mevalonate kinase [Anaerolineales bacterium]|nr:mevalonate kinase [Anaerolineales bacterium]
MTRSSAPGKIILFGEHAVVYGRPALAVPVTQIHVDVDVRESPHPGIWIEAPAVSLHAELNTLPSDHPVASVIHNFFFLWRVAPFPNLQIDISSTIPVASGLGSGAAVTVALTRALASYLNLPMSDEQVNSFAFEIEKLHHGTPSGIDNTVISYAKPVYFVKGRSIEIFKVGSPFTIVIGNTGISAPTKESVGDVRRLWEADPQNWDRVFDRVGSIANQARQVIERGDINKLGGLMNENHASLQELTVSSPELDRLVSAACDAGAPGAKMSGGGRGGNMIALVMPEMAEHVARALKEAGATDTIITRVS